MVVTSLTLDYGKGWILYKSFSGHKFLVLVSKLLKVSIKNTPGSPYFDSFWSLFGPFFTKNVVAIWFLSGSQLTQDNKSPSKSLIY